MDVADDIDYNLGLKKESWVPDPARFITMHEWAAYPLDRGWPEFGIRVRQWHNVSNPTEEYDSRAQVRPTIDEAPVRFVAPALFVDGHSRRCDYTAAFKKDPSRALDPTKDWMWYKPLK